MEFIRLFIHHLIFALEFKLQLRLRALSLSVRLSSYKAGFQSMN